MPFSQPISTGLYAKRAAHIRGNIQETMDFLDALMKPTTVSIIHCPRCQKEKDSLGNNQAYQGALHVTLQEPIQVMGLRETLARKWDGTKGLPHLEYT